MIKKTIFLFMLIVAVVLADGYIASVTTSTTVSTATTGTNFQVTAVITAGSEQITASSIQLISTGSATGGSFTISDPPSGSYSNTAVSTSGTTKTFTATAGVADTYTYYVTAVYSGGSKSSTSAIIEFVDPSTLTVSGTPSDAGTKSATQSYTLDVNIQNPSSSDVVTSYTLTCPSGVTCAGDPETSSGTTITASSTTPLQWTVTIDSDFSGTKDVVLQVGDNTAAFTSTITGSVATTTTTSSSTGGGGGGETTAVTTSSITTTTVAEESATTTTTLLGETTTTIQSGALSPEVAEAVEEYWWYILAVVIVVVLILAAWYYHPHLFHGEAKATQAKKIKQEIKQAKKER